MTEVDDLLEPLRADPATTAVLTDFDGTLSTIVEDPAAARPLGGAVEVLAALAERYHTVAVVSGRPVAFLAEHLPSTIDLVGVYGLEWLHRGEVVDHPDAAPWRAVVAAATEAATAELPDDVLVEAKGISVSLHYRTAPHRQDLIERWADARAAADGLALHPGKMNVELTPPVAIDKGTTVRALASGMRAACFLGDDIGDLPAFTALDELRTRGMDTATFAVRTPEAALGVLAAADAVVDGPEGALDVLRRLR
jgi:trehalose 6-phosphate phosphatase